MKNTTIPVDLRQLRLRKINEPEYRHFKLLLYWPIYGLLFLFVERFYPVQSYFSVWCPLDDRIPFLELFLIPYLFWFVYLVGMLLYSALYDPACFRKLMYEIMITYTCAILVYLIWPTCQNLRPETFERDNFLTWFMGNFYRMDTNTNVCPSIHVLGSLAVMNAGLHCQRLSKKRWKIGFPVAAVLICVSTVFVKQHSVLDVLAALPVALVAYLVVYKLPLRKSKRETVPEGCRC